MDVPSFKEMAAGTMWFTSISTNILTGRKNNLPVIRECSCVDEKEDILERANWLCDKVIVEPKRLIKSMRTMLGTYYGTQWASTRVRTWWQP